MAATLGEITPNSASINLTPLMPWKAIMSTTRIRIRWPNEFSTRFDMDAQLDALGPVPTGPPTKKLVSPR